MFKTIEAGKVFSLKDKASYEKGKAVKTPFIQADGTTMILVSIDHAELPEHAAPADALVSVIEGEGDIVYKGVKTHVKEHDSFKFDKGALHSVSTDHKLKFSLLLIQE